MRITLSTNELPELVEKGATYEPFQAIQHTHFHRSASSYQPPTRRKLSRSAKARARKREKALQPKGLVPMDDT